jgi:uncharacterized coiled-coil DUF342 family protein
MDTKWSGKKINDLYRKIDRYQDKINKLREMIPSLPGTRRKAVGLEIATLENEIGKIRDMIDYERSMWNP